MHSQWKENCSWWCTLILRYWLMMTVVPIPCFCYSPRICSYIVIQADYRVILSTTVTEVSACWLGGPFLLRPGGWRRRLHGAFPVLLFPTWRRRYLHIDWQRLTELIVEAFLTWRGISTFLCLHWPGILPCCWYSDIYLLTIRFLHSGICWCIPVGGSTWPVTFPILFYLLKLTVLLLTYFKYYNSLILMVYVWSIDESGEEKRSSYLFKY